MPHVRYKKFNRFSDAYEYKIDLCQQLDSKLYLSLPGLQSHSVASTYRVFWIS